MSNPEAPWSEIAWPQEVGLALLDRLTAANARAYRAEARSRKYENALRNIVHHNEMAHINKIRWWNADRWRQMLHGNLADARNALREP